MIVVNAKVLSVTNNSVIVYDNNFSKNITILLPNIISRLPVVGDNINYIKDDVDEDYGLFISYYGEAPIVFNYHTHRLLSVDIIDNMPILEPQKAELYNKQTGVIYE